MYVCIWVGGVLCECYCAHDRMAFGVMRMRV